MLKLPIQGTRRLASEKQVESLDCLGFSQNKKGMKWRCAAWTEDVAPLFVCEDEKTTLDLLLIGGVHGNEPEGVWLCKAVMAELLKQERIRLRWAAIPEFNPEGLAAGTRVNGRGVDLNRNLPTRDWSKDAFNAKYPPGEFANSEKENQFLVSYLEERSPRLIMSFHSFEKTLLNVNGACREVAEAISAVNQFPIVDEMGYPTPGCLGTYAGLERNSPTITYEIQRGASLKEVLRTQLPAVMAGLRLWEDLIEKENQRSPL